MQKKKEERKRKKENASLVCMFVYDLRAGVTG
jgi:hypothetical protein